MLPDKFVGINVPGLSTIKNEPRHIFKRPSVGGN